MQETCIAIVLRVRFPNKEKLYAAERALQSYNFKRLLKTELGDTFTGDVHIDVQYGDIKEVES